MIDYWTAFVLGLIGSVHCAGMCGPLALALPQSGNARWHFVAGRVAYNVGRTITYCLLGTVFGLVGKSFLLIGLQRWVSIGLGVLLLAGLISSRKLSLWRPLTALVSTVTSQISSRLRRRSAASLLQLGLLNGLLPCGLVYVACAGAAATGGLLSGTGYMAAFGLGTVPMLLSISLSGSLVPLAFRAHLRKAIPVAVFCVAALLILRGMSLGIPYLSPDLSTAGPACCQK